MSGITRDRDNCHFGHALWLVCAGGWQYLLMAATFCLAGTGLYVWARTESHLPIFTRNELAVFAGVVSTPVGAVVLMATGELSVLCARTHPAGRAWISGLGSVHEFHVMDDGRLPR